jgi:hypothetical protein
MRLIPSTLYGMPLRHALASCRQTRVDLPAGSARLLYASASAAYPHAGRVCELFARGSGVYMHAGRVCLRVFIHKHKTCTQRPRRCLRSTVGSGDSPLPGHFSLKCAIVFLGPCFPKWLSRLECVSVSDFGLFNMGSAITCMHPTCFRHSCSMDLVSLSSRSSQSR